MTVTLDDVQVLVDQLSLKDKVRLAAHLNEQLAQNVSPAESTSTDAWERLLAFRRDIEALEEDAPDFAAQLDADRRTRVEAPKGISNIIGG